MVVRSFKGTIQWISAFSELEESLDSSALKIFLVQLLSTYLSSILGALSNISFVRKSVGPRFEAKAAG